MTLHVMWLLSQTPAGYAWATSLLSSRAPWTTLNKFPYCPSVFFSRYSFWSTITIAWHTTTTSAWHTITTTKLTNPARNRDTWRKRAVQKHLETEAADEAVWTADFFRVKNEQLLFAVLYSTGPLLINRNLLCVQKVHPELQTLHSYSDPESGNSAHF
jgi:hypothetical protein